jgi:hypothetical protein
MDRESQRAFDSIAQKYSGRVEILINEKSDNPLFVGLIGRRALNIDVLLSNLEKLSPIERSSYLIDLPYVTLRAPKGYSIQNSLLSDFNIEFIDATLGVAPLAIETVETLIQSAQISNENA